MAMRADRVVRTDRRFAAPGTHLCGLAWDGENLWHSDAATDAVYALDPATGEVRARFACPSVRTGITWTGELLVQIVGRPKRLCYLRRDGEIVGYRPLDPPGERFCGIEADGPALWLGLEHPGAVELRDGHTLQTRRAFAVEGDVAGLTLAPGVVVYADHRAGLVRAVHAGTGELLGRRRVAGAPTGLTWDGTLLWYCDYDAREICAVDPAGLW